MKYSVLLLLILLNLASQIQAANWPLDDVAETMIVRGTAKAASGVSGQSLALDGTSLIELKESAKLASDAFTAFAGGKQTVEVLKVKLSDIDAVEMPETPLIAAPKP